MGYTPTSWSTGDTITASALNKIEQGIANAGSALICNAAYDDDVGNTVLDKTAQEIYDAMISGTPVYVKYQYGTLSDYTGHLLLAPVVRIYNYDYTNVIRIFVNRSNMGTVSNHGESGIPGVIVFFASGVNGYPVFDADRTTQVNNSSMINASIT